MRSGYIMFIVLCLLAVGVLWLFLTVVWVGLQVVIVFLIIRTCFYYHFRFNFWCKQKHTLLKIFKGTLHVLPLALIVWLVTRIRQNHLCPVISLVTNQDWCLLIKMKLSLSINLHGTFYVKNGSLLKIPLFSKPNLRRLSNQRQQQHHFCTFNTRVTMQKSFDYPINKFRRFYRVPEISFNFKKIKKMRLDLWQRLLCQSIFDQILWLSLQRWQKKQSVCLIF